MEEKKVEEKSKDVQVQSDNHHEPDQEEKLGQEITSQEGTGAFKKLRSLIANKKEADRQLTLARKECGELHGKQEKFKEKIRNLKEQRETLLIENATLKEEKRIREREMETMQKKMEAMRPGQEAGARSQDVQSESGEVTSSTPPSPKQEIDILLIGKTGSGKSSTGNSILNRNEFKTSSEGTSATYDVHQAWTDIDDYIVKVIDGPGVAETRLESAKAAQKACDDMAKAMSLCPKGFHALLLVLKFGERFTREEEDCIAMLKSIFGPNIVRDYCVIVITHGELFDMEDDCDDFSNWLAEQEGPLKKLFIECKYRCVLMRNKSKKKTVQETQRRELMETLHTMKYGEIRYTNELFPIFQQERNRLVVDGKASNSDAEKGELQEKILAISQANGEKMDQLNRTFNQKMDEAKREEAEKWQTVLDETRAEHSQQMAALQSQYQAMKTTNAETMRNMQAVSEQLVRLQRTMPPPKDPTKVTLHCKDQEGRIVSVTIPKTSPIGPLMQSYYGMSGYPPQVIKFCFDGKPVVAYQTPSGLQLEEDDMIEALL